MSQSQTYNNYNYYMPMVTIIDISDNMIKKQNFVYFYYKERKPPKKKVKRENKKRLSQEVIRNEETRLAVLENVHFQSVVYFSFKLLKQWLSRTFVERGSATVYKVTILWFLVLSPFHRPSDLSVSFPLSVCLFCLFLIGISPSDIDNDDILLLFVMLLLCFYLHMTGINRQ